MIKSMCKKTIIIWILLTVFMVFGCGSGSSDNNDSDISDSNDDDVAIAGDDNAKGTLPFLLSAKIYLYEGGELYENTVFDIGDSFAFMVTFTDIDKDVSGVYVTQYHPADAETPYYGPTYFAISSQENERGGYWPTFPLSIIGPSGTWRIEFVLEDSGGNISNVITKNAKVN